MLNNKADFILEYNEKMTDQLRREDIDWTQSRVVFVAPSFTAYQKEAINFKDLPIDLWEVKRFANKTISYTRVQTAGSKESIKSIAPTTDTDVAEEIKVYTESDHLQIATTEVAELYEQLKKGILNLGNIEVAPKKKYIAFVAESNVVDIHIQKNALKLWINLAKGKLDDPKGLARDVADVGHWGNGDYEVQLRDAAHLEYLLSLIKQAM